MSADASAPPLLLASASPRRRALLKEAGYRFRCATPDVDESAARELSPRAQAEVLAERKARSALHEARNGEVVLGADTVVVCDGRPIGKPSSHEDALAILRFIRGKRHSVITGVCLIDSRSGASHTRSAETYLMMKPVSDAEIEAYVRSGESFGKAGAYAVQETGDRFIEIVDGSYTNVVGLPMELVKQMLRETWNAERGTRNEERKAGDRTAGETRSEEGEAENGKPERMRS